MSKSPDECTSLSDVRAEIDRIDQQIVNLIGQRAGYVRVAARFKTSAADVRAAERVEAMLRQRRIWAEEIDLSPDLIERLYRESVAHFTQHEMANWKGG
ncbi:MAG: chorismate mutase [Anaerolineae bacterium]|nr:chorismate mutase [Anaerolineae bacterium]